MQNNKAPERIYALLGKHTYEDGSRIITGYSYIMGDVEYIRADLVEKMVSNAVSVGRLTAYQQNDPHIKPDEGETK